MVLFLNLLINIDHGILPGGVDIIPAPDALNLKTTQYGNLESAVFFGNIIGSLMATFVF